MSSFECLCDISFIYNIVAVVVCLNNSNILKNSGVAVFILAVYVGSIGRGVAIESADCW